MKKCFLQILFFILLVSSVSAVPFNDVTKVNICNSLNFTFTECTGFWLWADSLGQSVNQTIIVNNTINQTIYVNQTSVVNSSLSEAALLREHEYKMKELELRYAYGNLTTTEPAKSYTQEELDFKISEAISSANPPGLQKQQDFLSVPTTSTDYTKSPLVWVLVAVGGIAIYFFFYKKKELPPPIYQNIPSEVVSSQNEQKEF